MSARPLSDQSAREIVGREFDAAFYLDQLRNPVEDPVGHYLEQGWAEHLDPTPGFRTRFYLRVNPDVAESGIDPFLHYLTEGRAQGRAATPEEMRAQALAIPGASELIAGHVDRAFYLDRCPSLRGTSVDPVQHYLAGGWKLGLDPSPSFSTAFYLERSPDVRGAGINPLLHFLQTGRAEGRAAHPDELGADSLEESEAEVVIAAAFDRDFYLRTHPEPAHLGLDPVKHYLATGWQLGWDPTPDFSTVYYLSRSPDVASAAMNPFHHYLVWGRREGRSPSPDAPADLFGPESSAERLIAAEFDAGFYTAREPQIAANHVVPIKHYLHYGWRNGADPSAAFSTAFYLQQDPRLAEGAEDPLHHYIRVGRARGRLPRSPLEAPDAPYPLPELAFLESELVAETIRPEFDAEFYADAYPDAVGGGADPVWEYVFEGWRAGRDPAPWFATGDYLARYPDVTACRYNPFFHYLVWGRLQGFSPHRAVSEGVRAQTVPTSRAVRAPDLAAVIAEVRASGRPSPAAASVDSEHLDLHWVIPDIDGPGRGGLMTVLRMVRRLELSGHRCTLWVLDPDYARTTRDRIDLVLRDYQVVKADIRLLSDDDLFPPSAVLIATSWPTAYRVRAARGVAAKAYFVQDEEPWFYAAGSRALAAEQTYSFDMAYLCAGPWLESKLAARGRWVRSFPLAADEAYQPARRENDPDAAPRIAFYAREHTSRRAVETGLLALELLARRGERFCVELFGGDMGLAEAPFTVSVHGVLGPDALQALYARCDLGLCFSASNYSLVPQEMMASALPVVELDGESTRAVFPEGVVTLAGPGPEQLADAIIGLLRDPAARARQADLASAWVGKFSWDDSARAVEAALREWLTELNIPRIAQPAAPAPSPKASVIIPTYNGGDAFKAVLARVLEQRTPEPFEVIVVDSSSDDGTWEHIETQGPQVRRVRIDQADFQHGRTRNFAASMAQGDHLCFLTQDALPADTRWLYDLVTTLERFPKAAGAFGRHRPRPGASLFVKRGIEDHFAHLDRSGLEVSKYLDLPRWRARDEGFLRRLHFFSSNNACIRRSVWARHPLPEIDYGEDQAWAAQVIEAGYSNVYAPRAAVLHSHDYTEPEMFERARIDTRFQIRAFGYAVAPVDSERRVREMNAGDLAWGVRNGASQDAIETKTRLNAAEVAGMMAGAEDAALDQAQG